MSVTTRAAKFSDLWPSFQKAMSGEVEFRRVAPDPYDYWQDRNAEYLSETAEVTPRQVQIFKRAAERGE